MDAIRNHHKRFLHGALASGENLGLRLDKLNREIDDASSHDHKDNMLQVMSSFSMTPSLLESYGYAFEKWCEIMTSQRYCEVFDIISTAKALLGTGNTSVHEFGVNLNKPWGVPYISGTTLKGLVSSYLAKNGEQDWWKSKDDSKKSDYQIQLFGGEREQDGNIYGGSIIFNDAWIYPASNEKWFVNDIINVHHQQYYGEHRLPDGTENPIPVKIAALKMNLKFFVSIQGSKKERQFVKSVLKRALVEEGIGGKTAVGYGRFEVLKSAEEKNAETIELISSADNETLLKLYKKRGNVVSLAGAFTEAVNKRPLHNELYPIYMKINPLKIVLNEIKSGKVTSVKDLSGVYKDLKKNVKIFFKANPGVKLSQMGEAQEIFDFAINKFNLSSEDVENSALLKQIAYTWEDVVINDDTIYEIVEKRFERKWPPIEGLKGAIQAADLDEEIKELVLMEIE